MAEPSKFERRRRQELEARLRALDYTEKLLNTLGGPIIDPLAHHEHDIREEIIADVLADEMVTREVIYELAVIASSGISVEAQVQRASRADTVARALAGQRRNTEKQLKRLDERR